MSFTFAKRSAVASKCPLPAGRGGRRSRDLSFISFHSPEGLAGEVAALGAAGAGVTDGAVGGVAAGGVAGT